MDEFTLKAITSLLFVVDPVGALPTYLALSVGFDAVKRRQTAWKATVVSTVILGLFAGGGNLILKALGLTLPALQIAGGLILLIVAVDMLQARRGTQETPVDLVESQGKEDIAVTPLAIPMLAGPASLSTVATLMSEAHSWTQVGSVYLAIALVGIAIYLTLLLAEPLYRHLGQTGTHILSRLLGLVLTAIAVQFVLDGLRASRPLG